MKQNQLARLRIVLGFVCICLPGFFTQANAGSGAEFLRLEIPARAGALSAGCADFVELDLYNRNPAVLAGVEYPQIALTHFSAFDDFLYEQLDASYPGWLGGTWAGRLFYATGAGFDEYDGQGEKVGTIEYHDALFHLAYSRALGESWEAGVGLKLFESRLAEYHSMGGAVDLGVRYRMPIPWLAFGLALQNIGMRSAFIRDADPLPMQGVVGAGVFIEPWSGHRIKCLVDYTQPLVDGDDAGLATGMEYELLQMLALRGGYRWEKRLGGLSLGAGFRVANLGLDYAFQPFSELGNTHRFTLTYAFASTTEKPAPTPLQPQPRDDEKKQPAMGQVRELKELPRHFESAVTFETPSMDPHIKGWRFEIRDQAGHTVRTMQGVGTPPAYLQWDGKNQRGRLMPQKGRYAGVFVADGKVVAQKMIPAGKVPRRFLFRDGKAEEPGVVFEWEKAYAVAQWTLQIMDRKTGKCVRTLQGRDQLPEKVVWDGKDDQGTVAPTDRTYSYLLQLQDKDSAGVTMRGDIRPIPAVYRRNRNGGATILIPGVLFDFDSTVLKPDMMDKILSAIELVQGNVHSVQVVCEGHSDDVGSARYNQALSVERARLIRALILKKTGIARSRISAKGFGKRRPINRSGTEKARAQNRRVEIRIILSQSGNSL